MKLKVNEGKWALELTLEPESVEELALLARFANNVKAEKPYVSLSFQNEPYMYLRMNKLSEQKQINSINNA